MGEREADRHRSNEGTGERELANVFPEENCWYEAILTLFREGESRESETEEGGIPNASAVGIRRKGGYVSFDIYQGSNSHSALEKNPLVGINIPSGPDRMDMFIRASLKGYGSDEKEFDAGDFEVRTIDGNTIPFLMHCSPHLCARIVDVHEATKQDDLGSIRVKGVLAKIMAMWYDSPESLGKYRSERPEGMGPESVNGSVGRLLGIPYSRAEGQLIEGLIAATRFISSGKKELRERMEEHLRSAEKIGGEKTREQVLMIRNIVYSSSIIEY